MMDQTTDMLANIHAPAASALVAAKQTRLATLEEVSVELERLIAIEDDQRDNTMDLYDLKDWLDQQIKEGKP